MRNIKEEQDYNNETPASIWSTGTFEVSEEYSEYLPAGTYRGTAAGEHLISVEYMDGWFAIIHLPSRTVLLLTYFELNAQVMLGELDRPGVDWNVTDLGSKEAESARLAIWMMKRVIKTGGYVIDYQIWPNDGDDLR
jgi:hypothetical protein